MTFNSLNTVKLYHYCVLLYLWKHFSYPLSPLIFIRSLSIQVEIISSIVYLVSLRHKQSQGSIKIIQVNGWLQNWCFCGDMRAGISFSAILLTFCNWYRNWYASSLPMQLRIAGLIKGLLILCICIWSQGWKTGALSLDTLCKRCGCSEITILCRT